MDDGHKWSKPQKAPPQSDVLNAGDGIHQSAPPLPQWHYAGALHHYQQQLSYSSNLADPNSNYYLYQYNSIGSSTKVQELTSHSGAYAEQPLATVSYPLDGAAAFAGPSYPDTVKGSSTVAIGSAVKGGYGYSGEDPRTIASREAIRLFGAHPMAYSSKPWKLQKYEKFTKSGSKKTSKVVQAAFCEVCKVDCNSQDVLKSHNDGKKHKRKLKQLQDGIKREAAAKAQAGEPTVTEDRSADDSEQLEVDLKTKRSKILNAGGYIDEVRVCTICNIVVNSEKVFEYHLEGQKHAAMVEKLQETELSR